MKDQLKIVTDKDIQVSCNRDSEYGDLKSLRNNPLIKQYASVNGNLYDLIKATNPTLLFFIDLSKKIVEEDCEE